MLHFKHDRRARIALYHHDGSLLTIFLVLDDFSAARADWVLWPQPHALAWQQYASEYLRVRGETRLGRLDIRGDDILSRR